METVSDHEEDEQLGPDDDDGVTGNKGRRNTNMMQLLTKDLLSFMQKTTVSTTKVLRHYCHLENINFSTNFLADVIRGHTIFESRRKPFIYPDKMCR